MAVFNTYYSARELLGYNSLFNLVLSDRSDGKTFNCKVRALEDYDKLGETTIYMRRYDTEITPKMYNSFLDEVFLVDKYSWYAEKYEFRHSKTGVEIRERNKYENKKEGWKWLIYFIPLSKAGKLKSQLDITNIRTINFDEYVPLDGRYLKDEMLLLLEMWKSVDRDRDRTQCILLGNKITPFCPFLDFFGITLDIEKSRIRQYRDNTVAVQIYINQEHRETRQQSKFASAISGTDYQAYDEGGILNNVEVSIRGLSKQSRYLYSFATQYGEGSVYQDLDGHIIITDKIRKDGIVFTDTTFSLPNRQCYNIRVSKYRYTLRTLFYSNAIHATNANVYHKFLPIIKQAI